MRGRVMAQPPLWRRLYDTAERAVAPLLAASIFLDVLNVFLFFLQIFSSEER